MSWTSADLAQMKNRGIDTDAVECQLKNFKEGFAYLPVVAAATVGNGIIATTPQQNIKYEAAYENALRRRQVLKFVPASGAATRMFKDLFAFVRDGKQSQTVDELLNNIDRFAFSDALFKYVRRDAAPQKIVDAIVDKGLEYGSKPKAMVLFHRYPDEVRTAIEEHLVEGAEYANAAGHVNIHFTVSPEHIAAVKMLLDSVQNKYEKRYGVQYHISFSVQRPGTDTIAVNPDNTPFRDTDGSLVFRPAGHGALIENLGALDADIIFIKNIDNVTVDSRRDVTIKYKKILGGVLVEAQHKAFSFIKQIDRGVADAHEIAEFIEHGLSVQLPAECNLAQMRQILNRPIRVCGMVRNEGEPGGGPFWVKGSDGTVSLQIAESSQIAPEDRHLMQAATHFNPVDLVCGVLDYKGDNFVLKDFVDQSAGFISNKSFGGRELRAQELPGLWNGSMAYWNTLFVEVPSATFTPVKTVTDLLRAEHQN